MPQLAPRPQLSLACSSSENTLAATAARAAVLLLLSLPRPCLPPCPARASCSVATGPVRICLDLLAPSLPLLFALAPAPANQKLRCSCCVLLLRWAEARESAAALFEARSLCRILNQLSPQASSLSLSPLHISTVSRMTGHDLSLYIMDSIESDACGAFALLDRSPHRSRMLYMCAAQSSRRAHDQYRDNQLHKAVCKLHCF